ncbi:2-C-methyl-D-erythritol 4-phosphate cytidylyltransferase [Schaalia naturae]|jgi:2-C-methyl-D-erythritol 4-phosphate cytidylyltransferase|uniref:2-C-methyl-D-erythritol 4-phosphate cytidylyltransferase n=1 Tax=Schaalia naturae TaxID=635203 RepID=A0ABW2SRC3_9ACTO
MSVPEPALAVVTAAGSGTRLGCEGPKALVPVAGEPMVRRAVRLLALAGIAGVVVTAPEESLAAFRVAVEGIRDEAGAAIPVEVTAGSAFSRQASVARGLDALPDLAARAGAALDDATPVLVHDAARCLTPPDLVRHVVAVVRSGAGAVVPGLPVTDTLKQVGEGPVEGPLPVVGTPDRTRLRAVQTPQGFRWGVLRRAHRAARGRGGSESTAATDDASLVEALGLTVVMVPGDLMALKVTTRSDLLLAGLLASADDEGSGLGGK